MSKIECDEEEFVAGTDEEKCRLVWVGGEKRRSGQTEGTYRIVVVEPEDTADVRSDELVGCRAGHQ